MITHGKDGLFIRPGNLEELISGIKELGNNPEMRKRISIAARETTEKRFDKNRMVKDIQEKVSVMDYLI